MPNHSHNLRVLAEHVGDLPLVGDKQAAIDAALQLTLRQMMREIADWMDTVEARLPPRKDDA